MFKDKPDVLILVKKDLIKNIIMVSLETSSRLFKRKKQLQLLK